MENMQLDHIGIATDNIEKCISFYCDMLGFELVKQVEDDEMKIAYCRNGKTIVEFLQPKGRNDYAKGITHTAYRVTNLDELAEKFRQEGVSLYMDSIMETDKLLGTNKARCIFASAATGEYVELIEVID